MEFRMREIEIPHHLPARAGNALPLGPPPEPGCDRPHPAADGGGQSFLGGHDRQNETSQDQAQSKRRPPPDVLT
jgi:hypothetical protein